MSEEEEEEEEEKEEGKEEEEEVREEKVIVTNILTRAKSFWSFLSDDIRKIQASFGQCWRFTNDAQFLVTFGRVPKPIIRHSSVWIT